MAYVGWKDITAVTWNSKAHMAWVDGISGLSMTAVMQDRTAAGSAWPTPVDTGMRQQDDVVIEYLYDSAATPTPNADITIGQSATLLITLGTNQSITGTFVVGKIDIGVTPEKLNTMSVTFKPTGTITWDLLAA